MKKKNLSLRAKIVIVFVSVVFLVALLYFLMNNIFWNVLYFKENQQALQSAYEELATLVKNGRTSYEDLSAALDNTRTGTPIQFGLQGEEDWEFNVVTRDMNTVEDARFLRERLQADLIGVGNLRDGIEILVEEEHYTIQQVTIDQNAENRFLECYGYMENEKGEWKNFILSMRLHNFIRTKSMTETFFIFLTCFVLFFGISLICFATYRMTKPVYQLMDISTRMKNLDFSVKYTGKRNDEIGRLGENINEMSVQLEKTIRDLKEANGQLSRDLEEKEHIDEMRKEFISNASHELKTPIAIIQGYAESLEDWKDYPENFRRYCQVIRDESEKMNRLVMKMSALNQLEFGTADLVREPFDLKEMVDELRQTYREKTSGESIVWTYQGPEEAMVLGDSFEIEEVIENYVSNACHFVKEPKEIRFTIEDRADKFRLFVYNSGDRIPEEELDKIWIKFYKVDKARTRAYGGSGIGLSIVAAIMKAHQEKYGVQNEPDGVSFWFELSKAKESL